MTTMTTSEILDTIIPCASTDPRLAGIDWAGYWPVIDDHAEVIGYVDSEAFTGDYRSASIVGGKVIVHGEDYDGDTAYAIRVS